METDIKSENYKFASQKGAVNWTLLIFLIVFTFAFWLAGGSIFFFCFAPSPDYSDEMMPRNNFEGTPITTPVWSLTIFPREPKCKIVDGQTVGSFRVDAIGPRNGYIMLEEALTSGGYAIRVVHPFVESTGTTYELALPNVIPDPNKFGYHKSSWRIRLFEGGKKNGFYFTGGILRATVVNNPTSCLP